MDSTKPDHQSSGSPDSFNSQSDSDDSHTGHYGRYAVFVVMEAGFTVLAWYCYHRPRLLPGYAGYFETSTLKSGFITLFNVWHTIATACASEVCYEAFSREWAARKEGKERTDMVSKVTSGIFDRINYAISYSPTRTYKAAFFIFLGLIVMNNAATSAVTVTEGVDVHEYMDIGLINTQNISPASTTADSSTFNVRLTEASMVVRLEQLYSAPWGYVPQPNWLIPLPANQEFNMTQRVIYNSDLVRFQHDCRWQVLDRDLEGSQITVGNQTWSGSFFTDLNATTSMRNASSVLHLTLLSQSTGSSAYLFLGGNATFPLNSTSPNEAWIDLSNLPTVSSLDGIFSYHPRTGAVIRAPVAALLICDPKLFFISGPVRLEPVSDRTEPDVTVIEGSTNSGEQVGNIDQSAARFLFTSILAYAINQQDLATPLAGLDFIGFNAVAGQMFLRLPPWQSRNYTTMAGIRPLDLASIDQNADNSMLSALKAFTSGYHDDPDTSVITGEFTKTVDAYSMTTLPALATNLQFAILHSVLFGVLVIGLAAIVCLNRTQNRKPFTLKVLEAELQRRKSNSSS